MKAKRVTKPSIGVFCNRCSHWIPRLSIRAPSRTPGRSLAEARPGRVACPLSNRRFSRRFRGVPNFRVRPPMHGGVSSKTIRPSHSRCPSAAWSRTASVSLPVLARAAQHSAWRTWRPSGSSLSRAGPCDKRPGVSSVRVVGSDRPSRMRASLSKMMSWVRSRSPTAWS